jgi:hypothetical protein
VAEYFFRGFSRKEVSTILSDVFSKDIDRFPFPPHVRTRTQRSKYLAQGTLQNQLHGFTYAFKQPPQSGNILVKVYGGNFPADFAFNYYKVKFYGKEHPVIERVKSKMKPADISSFFATGDYIIATAGLEWHSQESLQDKLTQLVRSELTFLSAIIGREFSVDTTANLIRLSARMQYQGMAWSTRQFDSSLHLPTLAQLTDNAYEVLRKFKGQAVDWFLKYEPLFVLAHKSNSISDYWLYLETLLSHNQPKKNVMEKVSSIILANEKFVQEKRILTTILESISFFSGGHDFLNVPFERLKRINTAIRNKKLPREIRRVDYPFIKELVKEYDTPLGEIYYKKAKEYYLGVLTEAYEYRNFLVHSGLENKTAKEKLVVTVPNIVIRLRWVILDAIKNGQHGIPFDLIIEDLVKKGNHTLHP